MNEKEQGQQPAQERGQGRVEGQGRELVEGLELGQAPGRGQ